MVKVINNMKNSDSFNSDKNHPFVHAGIRKKDRTKFSKSSIGPSTLKSAWQIAIGLGQCAALVQCIGYAEAGCSWLRQVMIGIGPLVLTPWDPDLISD